MKLTTTTTDEIHFQVCYHEATEGGMDYDTFGPEQETLPAAVRMLHTAQATQPMYEWTIECHVSTICKDST